MRAILAGGGTGGHVIPALAIAHELRERYPAEVIFIGTSRGIENRLVPAAGFELQLVRSRRAEERHLATRIEDHDSPCRARSFASAETFSNFRPDVVIGVGGYASGPAMLAAAFTAHPQLAFEPNVVPGLRQSHHGADCLRGCVHFEETCRYFRNCQVTGVPVRRAFFDMPPRPADVRQHCWSSAAARARTPSTKP